MRFEQFRARAEKVFGEIPPEFREGVDGLEVTRRTVTHPSLPEVYTLGECLSDFYPSEFGGPGDVRSRVVLYYGSFLEVSRDEDAWDWDGEIWETITHEIKHHLEHLASEDALEEQDYADDQNFARREGQAFDPYFFRSGEALGPGLYSADRDVFIERTVRRQDAGSVITVEAPGFGPSFRISLPAGLAEVNFLRVIDPPLAVGGELFVVVLPRRGAGDWFLGLLRREPTEVLQADVTPERSDAAAI